MRALVIHCHPRADSFSAAVRDCVLARLAAQGAEARLIDLYELQFDPVLSRAEFDGYADTATNNAAVSPHTEAILWCDTLIFVYPTWWYGLPAMLKGWLDRALLPGLAFHLPAGSGSASAIRPGLTHITAIAVFTTCGASRWLTFLVGAPGRRTLLRGLRLLLATRARTQFTALYSIDSTTLAQRSAHLRRVAARVDRLCRVVGGSESDRKNRD